MSHHQKGFVKIIVWHNIFLLVFVTYNSIYPISSWVVKAMARGMFEPA